MWFESYVRSWQFWNQKLEWNYFYRSKSSAFEQETEAVWAVAGGSRGDDSGHAPHHPLRPGGLLGSSDDPGTPFTHTRSK